MLKEIPGHETRVHFCEKIGTMSVKPVEAGKRKGVQVLIHDVHPYLFILDTKVHIAITYCPFCGAEIEKEELA